MVCTGNVCRSPMAEYLLRSRLRRDAGWVVTSAGLAAAPGLPPSWGAVTVMHEIGIDLSDHRSRPLTADLVRGAHVIVVMTVAHRELLCALFSESASKTYLLKSFDLTGAGWDIDDPVGQSLDVYRGIRDEIASAIPGLIAFLLRSGPTGTQEALSEEGTGKNGRGNGVP